MQTAIGRLVALACAGAIGGCSMQSVSGSPPRSEGHIEIGEGIRLHHRVIGAGVDTIVVVHGGPDLDAAYLVPDLDPLASSYTVIFYDQRGAGRSTLISDSTQVHIGAHVADLERVRQHFGIERLTLLAHSFGALIAARYAFEHPDRLSRLVLVSPAPPRRNPYWAQLAPSVTSWMDSIAWAEFRVLNEAQRDPSQDAHATCREFWSFFIRGYLADPYDSVALRRMRGDFCDAPAAALRNRFVVAPHTRASLGDWDWRDCFDGVRVPVLVITGTSDLFPVESFREWESAFPDGRLVLLESAGHFPHVEQPVAFFSTVVDFLR